MSGEVPSSEGAASDFVIDPEVDLGATWRQKVAEDEVLKQRRQRLDEENQEKLNRLQEERHDPLVAFSQGPDLEKLLQEQGPSPEQLTREEDRPVDPIALASEGPDLKELKKEKRRLKRQKQDYIE